MTPMYYPLAAAHTCLSACRSARRRSRRRPWSPCRPRPAPRARARWRRSPTAPAARSGATVTSAAVALDRPHDRRRRPGRASTVPISAGAAALESANMPASRIIPGITTETPTPVPRRSSRRREGEAAEAELGRAVQRGPRGRRLAGERGDEDHVPGPASAPRGHQLARHPDRRLEVDPQRPPDLLLREVVEPARGRQGRVRDQDVDLAGGLEQRERLALVREVADHGPVAGARQRAGERLELVRLARAQHQMRAARPRAPRRSPARGRRWPR